MTPREWWINTFSNVVFKEDMSGPEFMALRMDPEIIHVIEHSAYLAEVERARIFEEELRPVHQCLAKIVTIDLLDSLGKEVEMVRELNNEKERTKVLLYNLRIYLGEEKWKELVG